MNNAKVEIEDVSDTAVWVAHYRAMETERRDALFKDPLAKILVGDKGEKIATQMKHMSKHTQWSVICRTLIIDRFITKLMHEGVDTVLNLGAGLDTRPYRMDLPPNLKWIEVDHPKVIGHKEERLRNEKPCCQLQRFSLDLTDAGKRKEFLSDLNSRSEKVLVLTEGVIPYLSQEQVRHLADELKSHSRIAYWITEYLSPDSYKHLHNKFRKQKMKHAPFLFYPEDWIGFFGKSGWTLDEIQYSSKVGIEAGRRPPGPWYASLLAMLAPEKVREKFMKMSGYIVFKK